MDMVTMQNIEVISDKLYVTEFVEVRSKQMMVVVVLMLIIITCNIVTIANNKDLTWPECKLKPSAQVQHTSPQAKWNVIAGL